MGSLRVLRFGKVVIDLENRVIYRGRKAVNLSEQYWNALTLLIERHPNTVDKEELQKVLGGSTTETLHKQIGLIRKALDNTNPQHFIRAERSQGYRFTAVPDVPKTISGPLGAAAGTALPEPQVVSWGPPEHTSPGIWIGSKDAEFVPWPALKQEIENLLIPKLKHVPLRSTVELGNLRDRQNWIIRILNPDGVEIGNVWFGTDPDAKWRFDGLVRVGGSHRKSGQVVWQVFQRYSDGTYRRIAAFDV